MYTNFCDEYFQFYHIFVTKVAGGRSSSFAIVTFLRQLLSITDVNYCQFLFFYYKQEYAALRLLQKYTKIMDHILFLHIRSNFVA